MVQTAKPKANSLNYQLKARNTAGFLHFAPHFAKYGRISAISKEKLAGWFEKI
jgi:hypothetical protein